MRCPPVLQMHHLHRERGWQLRRKHQATWQAALLGMLLRLQVCEEASRYDWRPLYLHDAKLLGFHCMSTCKMMSLIS